MRVISVDDERIIMEDLVDMMEKMNEMHSSAQQRIDDLDNQVNAPIPEQIQER